ncbi:TPA: Ni/Fe hydrogenase subunit alpha [Candidatus Poribacteria bacterium]|nr:Ni/Fe hydrogenase subunit alpha [Candidatus Poribacteria bacterium]
MSRDLSINVHHVTRVEGHGNIVVNLKKGQIEECKFEVVESPRFFEAMLRGRRWDEAQHITCRICGICSIGHTTASLNATEAAFGIQPSKQTRLLRRLLFHGEMMQSHILHFYYLVLPDLLGVGSVIPLAETHKEVVQRALRMKRVANGICEILAGRHVHPCAAVVKGFTKLPTEEELLTIKRELVNMIADVEATVDLFAGLEFPHFERETEYISLRHSEEYAFSIGEVILSSDGDTTEIPNYRQKIKEFIVPHSTAKHARANRDSYMVGALARVNNNYDQLSPMAKRAAEKLSLKVPCYNPFMNSVAQIVEVAHCVEDGIQVVDRLLSEGIEEEDLSVQVKAGTGVGAADVPRGMLIHEYTYDENGNILSANCVIPTNQNYANLELDMRAFLPQIIDKPKEEIRHLLEMLVRAYDPCISCSVHFLKVEFV